MDKKLICLIIIVCSLFLSCFLTRYDDVQCEISSGLVFVNELNDTLTIDIKRLGDSTVSDISRISMPKFKLAPSAMLLDSIDYAWIGDGAEGCGISNIYRSSGLRVVVTRNDEVLLQKDSYPLNDALNRDYVNVDEISGFVCDTIVIE